MINSTAINNRKIIVWLFSGCFLVLLMVLVGGITRLTGSGLSIVEWKPIMGVLPPLNENEWSVAFEKYKESPQFKIENYTFNLSDFKSIFWWEYIHRNLGRFIGLVFILPYFYFKSKKIISSSLNLKLIGILVLGSLQALMGWLMVKSGLVDMPHVSHYRLAMHLVLALITFSYTFWVALELIYIEKPKSTLNHRLASWVNFLIGLVLVQIVYGAFVAGLRAGRILNTWPKVGNEWIPSNMNQFDSFIANISQNPITVQFIHRMLAYTVLVFVTILGLKLKKADVFTKIGFHITLILILLQVVLGIITLLFAVPISLGVLHQATAFLVFGSLVYNRFRLSHF